jgi:hypothetical protein
LVRLNPSFLRDIGGVPDSAQANQSIHPSAYRPTPYPPADGHELTGLKPPKNGQPISLSA